VSGTLLIRNRQRRCGVNRRHLGRIVRSLLVEDLHCEEFELGIHFVSDLVMTGMNRVHLGHDECTDVITFGYDEGEGRLGGDIFICIEEARRQAGRYHTSWQREVVRYVAHGILHLCGYDDATPPLRRRMKRVEDRLVALAAERYSLARVGSGG
jgi:probable rRNA maturation factor